MNLPPIGGIDQWFIPVEECAESHQESLHIEEKNKGKEHPQTRARRLQGEK